MSKVAHCESNRSYLANKVVLIVDDEASIRKTLEGILSDEGISVVTAPDGETALEQVKKHQPHLVLLDIWMPGMDGLETLAKIKDCSPHTPVVMISGHANISTALAATRRGAVDFLEKPLDLTSTIKLIHTILQRDSEEELAQAPQWEALTETANTSRKASEINPLVFKAQHLKGRALTQKTIAHPAILYGQGLHSGKKSGLILEPLPANSGIHFAGVSESAVVPAHVDFVESTGFATTVRLGRTQAGTIEHLMSALCAYGISNLLIKCNGEVPVMDGSALEFCRLFDDVGVTEQAGEWYEIAVPKALQVGDGKEWIRIEPADELTIDYTLRYPEPVGEQHFRFTLTDADSYRREIAPSRTFSFVKDVGQLQKAGLALGGRFDNFLLIGSEGAINDSWRFSNEPVRHKILDAIGDLYLLGRPLRGKITACMTGHSDNIQLLSKVGELLKALS